MGFHYGHRIFFFKKLFSHTIIYDRNKKYMIILFKLFKENYIFHGFINWSVHVMYIYVNIIIVRFRHLCLGFIFDRSLYT